MKKRTSDLANRKINASGVVVEEGQECLKKHFLDEIIPKINARKHVERLCHIHDLEFYDNTYNCIGISANTLLAGKKMRFYNALNALYRKIVELTNIQSGGIGFINFDSDIAAYINDESDSEMIDAFREFFLNLNTNSRKGCEEPYVTFNFGLDTSDKGRRVSMLMLEAYEQGDENGNPLVFPNMVFKMKSGINVEENTLNHDIYIKALSVTAKRMVPTYFNCDSTSNAPYKAETIGIMGCRTRVVTNVNGQEGSLNRGNVACVTLNLVQMAYMAQGSMERFYAILDENLKDAKNVLLHRFDTLCEQGILGENYDKAYYLGGETNDVRNMMKNGTLSIGFIGLWDAMGTLKNCDIDSPDVMKRYFDEAYEIIKHMREYTDRLTKEEHMNFSLLASAAEGVTGNFAKYDNEHLGKDFSACKKGFYTNSFHVPVSMDINYRDKIEFEGSFHRLCNGGSITYVELKEMPGRNIEAVREIVECAYNNDCNYIGVNFPMDNCTECGYVGRIAGKCPHCGSEKVRRLRRVSGYLSEENNFTPGKKKEVKQRRHHMDLLRISE